MDDNHLTSTGLREMAAALHINTTVQVLPLPLVDITAALQKAPEETVAAVHALQAALCTNYAPARFVGHQRGRTAAASGSASEAVSLQVLDTLLEQVNATTARPNEDPALVNQAMTHVKDCAVVSSSLARLEKELIEAQRESIVRRLESFASGLTDMLSETVRSSVKDLLQTVEVETALAPERLWQPPMGAYHDMCQELIREVVLQGACTSIVAGAAQQVWPLEYCRCFRLFLFSFFFLLLSFCFWHQVLRASPCACPKAHDFACYPTSLLLPLTGVCRLQ